VRGVQGFNALSIDGLPKTNPGSSVPDVGLNAVTPEYFPVAGIRIERGRNFGAFDREHAEPVAIVNEALARKFFPNEDPVGKRVRVGDQEKTNPWLTIVGVVANERRSTVYDEMAWVDTPTLYRPLAQNVFDPVNLIFRSRVGQTGVVANEIRKRIATLDPGFPVGRIDTVQHLLAGYLAYPRFRARLLAGFAGLALLLAVVGLYGLLAQTVTQRTREIGIRMALGAERRDVLAMIAKQAVLLTVTGVVLGLVSVWGLTRLLKALLYGVSATDPATLSCVTMALLVSAILAACLPAKRATRVDPIISLRYE
jgi:predicted permease